MLIAARQLLIEPSNERMPHCLQKNSKGNGNHFLEFNVPNDDFTTTKSYRGKSVLYGMAITLAEESFTHGT